MAALFHWWVMGYEIQVAGGIIFITGLCLMLIGTAFSCLMAGFTHELELEGIPASLLYIGLFLGSVGIVIVFISYAFGAPQ